MTQKTIAQTVTLMGAFNQARNIGHDKFPLVHIDNAQLGFQGGEGVIGNFRLGPGYGRQESRLTRIGQAHKPRIGHQFQAQPNPHFLCRAAGRGAARGLIDR